MAGSRLIVVGRVEDAPYWHCRMCHKEFPKRQHLAFQQHILRCVEDSAQELYDRSPRTRLPFFQGDQTEAAEMERWISKHGRMPRDHAPRPKRKDGQGG